MKERKRKLYCNVTIIFRVVFSTEYAACLPFLHKEKYSTRFIFMSFHFSSPNNSQFQEKRKCTKKNLHIFSFIFFQEENRGLRLKEELVVAAEKIQQPSAMAAYPEEENLRYIFWRDPQSEQTPKNQSKRKKTNAELSTLVENFHLKCFPE